MTEWFPGRSVSTLAQDLADDPALRAAMGRQTALGKLYAGLAMRRVMPCRIVGVGSSTMQGVGATTEADRTFNQLIARLQAAFPSGLGTETTVVASTTATWGTISYAAGVHGYNAGEGGTTSANYLTTAEVASIGALDPRAIIHIVGSNDFATGITPTAYKTNVQGWVNALKAVVPNPVVQILVHTFQRMDTPSPAYPWADYGTALREIAEADPDNVVYIDLSDEYRLMGIPTAVTRSVAAGATIATDTLRRSGTGLGIAQTGQPWTADGTWSTTTSGASCTAGNGLAYVDVGTGDMDVSATVGITSGSGAIGLLLNAADFNNRLVYYLNAGAGTWNLGKFDASGSLAALTSGSGITTGAGTSHVLRALSSGATITLYVDGVQVGTYTLTAPEQTKFKALTRAGLRHNPAVVGTFTDFAVKAVNAGTVAVVDPLNLVGTDSLHQTDAGHAFMATLVARDFGVLTA